MNAINLIFHI